MENFELPPRKSLADFLNQEPASTTGKNTVFAKVDKAPRKGKSWSEEEHLAFLTGLNILGKGNWRGIARYYVPTRTSTQIASHAQKYLQRVSGTTKRKSKFSEIEQQAHEMRMTNGSAPPRSSPKSQVARSRSAPTGSVSCSNTDEQKNTFIYKDPLRHSRDNICKPTPVRAVESEPDLIRLAHSLMSMNPANRLSPSDTSAFRAAPSLR